MADDEETSWWDEATDAVEQTYDSAVQTVEQTYDSTVQAVEQTYDSTVQAVEQTYDSTVQAVEQTYDSTVQAVEQAYDYGAEAVEQAYDYGAAAVQDAYDWAVDLTSGADARDDFCEDLPPEESHMVQVVGIEGGFIVAKVALKKAGTKIAGAVVGGIGMAVTCFEIVYYTVTEPDVAYYRQLCGEYYEQLQQWAEIGCSQAFQASCTADHGGSGWAGPYRMAENEAVDDMNAHLYEWPDHELIDGDATVTPVPGDLYAAGCDADHGGSSWSGLERASFDEAADDLVAHLYEWPDHQLDTDDGRPGARVRTMTRDPNVPGGYRP